MISLIFEILLYSTIPTITSLLITGQVKGSMKNYFDKKLESTKKEYAIEIAKFESEINALKAKENFKFTKLHEKRMEVLEFSYKYLNDSLHNLNLLVVPLKHFDDETTNEENEKMLFRNFIAAQNNFNKYYSDNKIYFNDELEKLIDSYNSEIISIYNDYNSNHYLKQFGDVDKDIALKAMTAYKKIPEKISPIKKEIEKKFKEVLEQ